MERQLRKIPEITACQKFMTPIVELSTDLGPSAFICRQIYYNGFKDC